MLNAITEKSAAHHKFTQTRINPKTFLYTKTVKTLGLLQFWVHKAECFDEQIKQTKDLRLARLALNGGQFQVVGVVGAYERERSLGQRLHFELTVVRPNTHVHPA